MNPAHLEMGTMADNMNDRIRDGTDNKGERHPMHKLTEEQVRQIKERLRGGVRGTARVLAQEYGVSFATISDINVGRKWAWMD